MLGQGLLEYEKTYRYAATSPSSAPSLFHHTIVDGVQVWWDPR
jgi:hypothetical protein